VWSGYRPMNGLARSRGSGQFAKISGDLSVGKPGSFLFGMTVSIDLFAELDQARDLARVERCGDWAERDDSTVVVQLDNGDYHVCGGTRSCPYAVHDRENYLVCPFSGIVLGQSPVVSEDPEWSGKSARSANPDDTAGLPMGGAWRARRDMFAASVQAHLNAKAFKEDADKMPVYVESEKEKRTREERQSTRRGALCVDQVAVERVPKRVRTSKKRVRDADQFTKLAEEASVVIERLLSTQRSASGAAAVGDAPVAHADPRLQNVDFVTKVALRRYVQEARRAGEGVNLVAMHDVIVAAHNLVREQRAAALERRRATARGAHYFSAEVKGACSRLVVALWRAACETPHMLSSKRGADSFRPFVSGVLYALKRGITLPDGTVVVPALPSLATHLPTLRSNDATPVARQLHASSHRGLCSLHRSVASMTASGSDVPHFRDAAKLARDLVAHVRRLERGAGGSGGA